MSKDNSITFKDSLAGTGVKYVVGQARLYSDTVLHVQVAMPEVNRSYGLTFNAQVDGEFSAWATKLKHTEPSMHDGGAKYFPIQFKLVDGALHVQIKRTGKVKGLNRDYGYAGQFNDLHKAIIGAII